MKLRRSGSIQRGPILFQWGDARWDRGQSSREAVIHIGAVARSGPASWVRLRVNNQPSRWQSRRSHTHIHVEVGRNRHWTFGFTATGNEYIV